MTPKKEAALMRNAMPEPAAAITAPPNAGPMARAMLNPAEFSATADACCSQETISGVIACQAGSFITAPNPKRNVNRSSSHGVITPSMVTTPNAAAAIAIQVCVTRSNRLRSTRSATAPAGKAMRKTGKLEAACTRATMSGDIVNEVISQPLPRFCNHKPAYEITAATHMERNSGSRKGAQGERECGNEVGALTGVGCTGSINSGNYSFQTATLYKIAKSQLPPSGISFSSIPAASPNGHS